MKHTLHWLPRVLGILFALFLSVFALDVFDEGYGFWQALLALAIHLIPALLVVLAVAIAWRREALGGLILIGLAVWYLISSWGRFRWSTYLIIAGPAVLTGGLFLIDWANRVRLFSASKHQFYDS